MEGFERQLQELIDDFVHEVEDFEQVPACNGPTKSFKLVTLYERCNYASFFSVGDRKATTFLRQTECNLVTLEEIG